MGASGLSDADLHALVDGPLDAGRHADLLRRAAASPRDRGLVEDWQDQSEWIRGAFAGVIDEPLPPSLDLGRVRHLHAVPYEAPPAGEQAPPRATRGRAWRSTAATLIVMALGLAGSWYVAVAPERAVPAHAVDEGEPAAPLPTTTIPDLSRSGFAFVGAERPSGAASSLVFHYRKGANERVDVAVRSGGEIAFAPDPVSSTSDGAAWTRDGAAWTSDGAAWTSDGAAWTMSGSVPPERLRALAAGLRRGDPAP